MNKVIDESNLFSGIVEDSCREFLQKIRERPKDIDDMPNRAQDVLNFFHIKDFTSGVPIVEILTYLGFKIFQSDLEPDDLSAYIVVDPKFADTFGSSKITCVDINDSIGHKTFSLAHELAHYIFDFEENKKLNFYDTYYRNCHDEQLEEKRANQFAANLLMPEQAFLEQYSKCQKLDSKVDIVSELSRQFRVSPTAVIRRFNELDIQGFDSDLEMQI